MSIKEPDITFACPVCQENALTVFFEMEQSPVLPNVLYASRQEAMAAPRAPIRLAHCENCNHLYNTAYDPKILDYTHTYENSLYFSQHFRQYADRQAKDLIDRHNLHHKTVIEIGCGQGDFLTTLCTKAENHGRGYDPSYDPGKSQTALHDRVEIIREYFTEDHAKSIDFKADLIVCRQVLEHIPNPVPFLQSIRRALNNHMHTAVFFEVPDGLYTLRDMGIWDIIYEHCSYFTPKSLAMAFAVAGFTPQRVEETYGRQFLTIDAIPSEHIDHSLNEDLQLPSVDTSRLAADFSRVYQQRLNYWKKTLSALKSEGKRVVIWGAGSKGITFLNVLGDEARCIEYAVDLNPRKQGKFITGSGQQIVQPQFLKEYQPSLVIAMNPQYHGEIRQDLQQWVPDAELLGV